MCMTEMADSGQKDIWLEDGGLFSSRQANRAYVSMSSPAHVMRCRLGGLFFASALLLFLVIHIHVIQVALCNFCFCLLCMSHAGQSPLRHRVLDLVPSKKCFCFKVTRLL